MKSTLSLAPIVANSYRSWPASILMSSLRVSIDPNQGSTPKTVHTGDGPFLNKPLEEWPKLRSVITIAAILTLAIARKILFYTQIC